MAGPDVWVRWEYGPQEPTHIDDADQQRWAELARAAAGGDAASFAELVRASSPGLYLLAARITGDPDDAADVLQEAYVRTHDALLAGELRQAAAVAGWLRRTVARLAVDHLRDRARRARLAGELERAAPAGAEGQGEARAALAELAAWLGQLPAEQRAAIVLKDLEGYTSAEIGRLLGISEGAVEQRLVRGRAALRERGGHGH